MLKANLNTYPFLEGGGEMGKLTRDFNWSATSLGPIDGWPQSLRTVVDALLHSEVPMSLWWGHDMIQIYNDAYRTSLGEKGKHPSALGQKGEECWSEIWPIIKPLIDRVRQGGSTWSQDQLIPIFRNGQVEDVYWTFGYSPVRDEAGMISGVLVICNETTKKVNALKKIEESEKTLRSIILHAPVGICIIDGDPFTVKVVNDVYLALVGKTREQFEGKALWQVLPEARDQYADVLETVSRTGIPYEGKENRLKLTRHGKQETVYVDFVYEPMKADGRLPSRRIMVLAIDVTDKVIARKKIEESEQRYRMLIAESTVAIALYTGPDLRIQYVNHIMTGYWGKDFTVVGKPVAEAFPESIEQSFIEKLENVFRTGQTYIGSEEEASFAIHGKRKSRYFNYIYKALRDSEGVIYGIHHMAMDVTEQVKARHKVEELVDERTRELKESNKNLQRSNEELAQFAYIASHDLQEPARKISTFVEMLQRHLREPEPRARNLLDKIDKASARMLSLIRDVLTYSQLAKENQEVKTIDLNEVVNSVKGDFELLIEEKGARIITDDLPTIQGIPVQIDQLFGNLISNALKFTHKDRKPRITITCRKLSAEEQVRHYREFKDESPYYVISFSDNGIGFSQSNAHQIFDIFQRLHAKSEYQGTGIGLAMCKKIAQNHNGDIFAESTEGEGATFHVILPGD